MEKVDASRVRVTGVSRSFLREPEVKNTIHEVGLFISPDIMSRNSSHKIRGYEECNNIAAIVFFIAVRERGACQFSGKEMREKRGSPRKEVKP